jgi:hypothetical protein
MLRHCGPCKGQSLSIAGRDEDLRTAKNTFRDESPKSLIQIMINGFISFTNSAVILAGMRNCEPP